MTKHLTFKVENLGVIKSGTFEQKPLTLFCGPNNSGKTWAMYSLYHYYYYLGHLNIRSKMQDTEKDREIAQQVEHIFNSIDLFNKRMSTRLDSVFNDDPSNFKNTKFILDIPNKDWQILKNKPDAVFLIPAERSGLHLFFRELSTRRAALLHHASKKDLDPYELLRDVMRSRYAKPIADYIDWLNNLPEIKKDSRKRKTNEFHEFAQQLQKQVISGAYKVDSNTGDITFKPYQRKRDGIKPKELDLHLTSSTVKSLFGLWFYLEYEAKKNDVIMIDEPELNIHPENQIKIARILARLVNAGLNVVISTHSDYIVREFNSLIMLARDTDNKLHKEHGYDPTEKLSPDQVSAYLFDDQEITSFEITPDDGIYATTFDDVIIDQGKSNDDIYYSLQEKMEDSEDD